MAELELKQRAEEKVLNGILARDPDERDRSLTGLLSEENKQKAGDYFYKNLVFQNYELSIIYRSVMEFLLEELVVREGVIVPRRIINPGDEDKKFLELYSVLAQLDQSLADYKSFIRHNKSSESSIEAKLRSAEERLKIVQERRKTAESKKAGLKLKDENSKENHDAIKLDVEIERYKEEEADIKEQKRGYEKRMAFLDRELEGYVADSPLRSYFNFALAKAKELGLEKSLSFEISETKKDAEVSPDIDLLSRKIEGIPIEFVPYKKPVVVKEPGIISFLRRGKYYLGLGAAAVVLGGILIYGFKDEVKNVAVPERRIEVPRKPKLRAERRPYTKRQPKILRQSDFPEQHKSIPYKPFTVWFPSKRYIPAEIEIVSFNPRSKELAVKYGHFEEPIKLQLKSTDEQLRDVFPDIVLVNYRKEGDDTFEVRTFYGLLANGCWGLTESEQLENPKERKIPKEKIIDYFRDLAKDYKTNSINEADVFIKNKKVIDARYDYGRKVLTLLTTQHGFDIPINVSYITLSSQDYDNLPEAIINSLRGDVYLDFSSRSQEVRCVTPGENFNSIFPFSPLPNLTPKF
jgi:hypothetical protein